MERNVNIENGKVLCLMIVTFVLAIVNVFLNIFGCRKIHIYSIIISFIPLFILIIRNKMYYAQKRKAITVLTPTVVIVCVLIICINTAVTKIVDKGGNITNVKSYEKILKIDSVVNRKSLAHFPDKIPAKASDVKMDEWVSLSKKVSGFYLSYDLSDINSDILDEYVDDVQYKYLAKNQKEISYIEEYVNIPIKVREHLDIKTEDDVKLMIIDGSSSLEVSHGFCYGFGINESENRILFFQEKW